MVKETKFKQRETRLRQGYGERVGGIPAGWEKFCLGDLIYIKHGFAFKGKYFCDEPTKDIFLTPGNFRIGGGFKADKFKYYQGADVSKLAINLRLKC